MHWSHGGLEHHVYVEAHFNDILVRAMVEANTRLFEAVDKIIL